MHFLLKMVIFCSYVGLPEGTWYLDLFFFKVMCYGFVTIFHHHFGEYVLDLFQASSKQIQVCLVYLHVEQFLDWLLPKSANLRRKTCSEPAAFFSPENPDNSKYLPSKHHHPLIIWNAKISRKEDIERQKLDAQEQAWMRKKKLKYRNWFQGALLHVWYIYLHLVDVYGKCR